MAPRRDESHHRFRESVPQAWYFLTICTFNRTPALLAPEIAARLTCTAKEFDEERDTSTLAFVVMPDHCHWLFELGHRLALWQVVAKLKTRTREELRERGAAWQRDYYEHRLRIRDDPEDFALYIFMNPYRAGLAELTQFWPWWWTADRKRLRFYAFLKPYGGPPAEWLDRLAPSGVGPER